jgi:hypothetical protein
MHGRYRPVRTAPQRVAAWCLVIVLAAVTGAARAQAPAPGSSIATAIVLPGVQHETDGVDAEYAYIKKTYPGWTLKAQSLIPDKGRQYDAIQIAGPGGATQTVFFDITTWFGK